MIHLKMTSPINTTNNPSYTPQATNLNTVVRLLEKDQLNKPVETSGTCSLAGASLLTVKIENEHSGIRTAGFS